jgi:hypothetical protein
MERPTGIEPVLEPWQGPVLPLYYGRASKTLPRQMRADKTPPDPEGRLTTKFPELKNSPVREQSGKGGDSN